MPRRYLLIIRHNTLRQLTVIRILDVIVCDCGTVLCDRRSRVSAQSVSQITLERNNAVTTGALAEMLQQLPHPCCHDDVGGVYHVFIEGRRRCRTLRR